MVQQCRNLSTLEVLLLGPPAQQHADSSGVHMADGHLLPSGSRCISCTAIIAWETAFQASALPSLCVLEMLGTDDSQVLDLWEVGCRPGPCVGEPGGAKQRSNCRFPASVAVWWRVDCAAYLWLSGDGSTALHT